MSVVHQLSPGWLLDHLSFINKSNYQLHQHCEPCCIGQEAPAHRDSESSSALGAPDNVRGGSCETCRRKYVFRPELFDVTEPYITSAADKGCKQDGEKEGLVSGDKGGSTPLVQKKRKRCAAFNQGELDAMEYHAQIRGLILDGSSQLIQDGLKSGFLRPLSEQPSKRAGRSSLPREACSLSELCEMAKHLPSGRDVEPQALQLRGDDMSVREQDLFSRVVENSSSLTKMITLMGQKYLLPPKSAFLLSDVSCIHPLLACGKTYDVIVIDPPWQNKSVKRSSRYNYLSPLQIKQLPVPKLAAPNCLVITWVTNKQKNLRFVKEELYPSWSVEILAEWHWVKITSSGEFVFPLDSPHKKPYEVLILGRVREKTVVPLRATAVKALPVPGHKVLVSVPCVLHSHKPPLAGLTGEGRVAASLYHQKMWIYFHNQSPVGQSADSVRKLWSYEPFGN
ncbi:N(6)-adenine-specific methyltransferase METTL4 isoform X2 [Erinaceus europaeus]|uniref:N(6)-adenine-specific methyltransferase METTL4 isoform X2 n=1 Tax=Erinaceus europaeus TaxID=9365 RepID=A0ABM3Y6S8_ERIEU|nr:N(6)-adenine-specific methyltransferase METTL4 isoform X2 [Erinaceus europaeus]